MHQSNSSQNNRLVVNMHDTKLLYENGYNMNDILKVQLFCWKIIISILTNISDINSEGFYNRVVCVYYFVNANTRLNTSNKQKNV